MIQDVLAFTIVGLVTGAAYAIAASGLVLTYATSNVFNIAHGAIGMLMAYFYFVVNQEWGWPTWLSLLAIVFVLAPLFGAVIERLMMRRLTDATVTTSLTVTVGLLVMLIGAAQTIFPSRGRSLPPFFPDTRFEIFQVGVRAHEVLTFVIALLVAAGLYYVLKETRIGIGMRAVVDNRTLLALHGAKPQVLGQFSWAIGSSLAALAGVLLVSTVGFDPLSLTFLVINAYAAALVGKLTNLPRTFVGALILGLLISYFTLLQSFLPDWIDSGFLSGVRAALPAIFLLAVMIAMPQEKLRVGGVQGATLVKLPSLQRSIVAGVGLIAFVFLLVQVLSTSNLSRLGTSLAFAMIMLSLVVLSGYGGDVSLGQMTFVGFGALVVARLPFFGSVSPWSIVAAGLVAGLAGALVALPALRLRGLYLGLLTMAFASGADKLVFESNIIGFQLGGQQLVERPAGFTSEGGFTMLVAVAFVAMALFVLQLRRGQYGRFLLATRDSPAACGTLGLDITRTRVTVFAISAAMAGVAGAFFAGMRVAVGSTDFLMFQSLPVLLLAVVGGITSVSGALIGGLLLGMSPALQESLPALGGLINLLIGIAAVSLGRNPNGIAGVLFNTARGGATEATYGDATAAESVESSEEVSVLAAS